jgi:hypothetical protein
MIKLYKRIDGEFHYWESWEADKTSATIHWGIVGQKGRDKTVRSSFSTDFREVIQKEIDRVTQEGFKEISRKQHATLLIEYRVKGMGTAEDLKKRHALQDRMQETLGWTGLGFCDGGSIGSGSMEVCCLVVDFKIAKNVIKADLKGTEFENFTRIYDENAAIR